MVGEKRCVLLKENNGRYPWKAAGGRWVSSIPFANVIAFRIRLMAFDHCSCSDSLFLSLSLSLFRRLSLSLSCSSRLRVLSGVRGDGRSGVLKVDPHGWLGHVSVL